MPTVITSYRLLQPRHRRLGGGSSVIDLVPPTANHPTTGSPWSAPAPAVLPYTTPAGTHHLCNFAFWNVRNSGATPPTFAQTNLSLMAPVGSADPMSATAWYVMPGGPGGGSGGGSAVAVDAFSDELDDFIYPAPIASVDPASARGSGLDDDLVFTSNGEVTVETTEDCPDGSGQEFEQFILVEDPQGATSGRTLTQPQRSSGYAVVTYNRPTREPATIPRLPDERSGWVFVSHGVMVDGGGFVIDASGHIHVIPPRGPDTFTPVQEIVNGLAVHQMAGTITESRIRETLQKQSLAAAQAGLKRLGKQVR